TSTTTTEKTSTTTGSITSTSTSNTATTVTTTATTVTSSSTTTTSKTSTTSTTTTTTTSLNPEALSFLVEDHGPQATSMTPTTGLENATLVIQGHGLGSQWGAVYFVKPGRLFATSADASSCDVTSWQEVEVQCLVPQLAAGAYQVHVRVPYVGDAVVPEPFIAPLLLTGAGPATEMELLRRSNETDGMEEATAVFVLEGSMAGGQELVLLGAGFGHAKEATQVTVCGAPCEVLYSDHSEVKCRTPLLLTDAEEVLAELPHQ
ncbi:PKHD1L1, partial [Symbiodinium natans]